MDHPIAAPSIQISPGLKVKLINNSKSPLIIITKTPIRHNKSPDNLRKLNFSPKKKIEIKIINIGEDV